MSEANRRPVQLHLGCGRRFIPGFIHIDLDDHPHIDYRSSIGDLSMFADSSVDLVYCCHALEYFDRNEAADVLREWHRVLRSGGIVRVAVPDFAALTELYTRTGDVSLVLGPLFGRISILDPGGERLLFHKTTYDFKSLEMMCLRAGFHSVKRYDWRQTIHKDFDDFSQAYYPHMDKEHGLLISLNIEAVK